MDWQQFGRQIERLITFVVIVVLVVVVGYALVTAEPPTYSGVPVGLGDCHRTADGWEFCNTTWIKMFGYVTVNHDGAYVELLAIPSYSQYEYHGYTLTYAFPNLYIVAP